MSKLLAIIFFTFFHLAKSNSDCGIQTGFMKSARIEFDELTPVNTLLFTLPFKGTSDQITIRFKSNELNSTLIERYFEIQDAKKFILKSSYDLDDIKIDLIELVFVCSSLNSSSSNTFLLYITINDVNNKIPEFIMPENYQFQLKEFTPIGTVVYKGIKAIDKDLPNKPNSQISFSIVEGPCSDYFEFPLTTRSDLAMRKLVEYNSFSECNLTVKVKDHGYPQLSSTTVVRVSVVDVDDKDPVFTENIYHGTIKRNSQPGSVIKMPKEIFAQDQDKGINMTVIYQLTTNPNELFEINKQTGQLSLLNPLNNYEKTDYDLIIKAVQTNNPLKSALTMAKIRIIEVNEYPPKFDKAVYEATVMENADLGTLVCQVNAIDIDKNRLEYSFVNHHDQRTPFAIDRYSGSVSVSGRLDYEVKSEYVLTVRASDANFSTTAIVRILLINTVDTAPEFELTSYQFKFRIPHDVYIGQVRAVDIEKTNKLKFSIEPLNPSDTGLFCISQNGIIYICPKTISSDQTVQSTAKFNFTTTELTARFNKPEYKLNVTVSVYSSELLKSLKNTVSCRVEVLEQDTDKQHEAYVLKGLNTMATTESSPFLDENFFKDSRLVYIVIAACVGLIALLAVCCAVTLCLKWTRKWKQKNQKKKYSHHSYPNSNNKAFKFFPTFGLFDLPNHTDCSCSCSSRTSQSTCHKNNNTSSGISCISESSVVNGTMKLKPVGSGNTMPALSDYFSSSEVKVMKSSKLCGYSDLYAAPTSSNSLKKQDSPMANVRQQNDDNYFDRIPQPEYYQIQNKSSKDSSSDEFSQSKLCSKQQNECSSECSTSSSLLASSSCANSPKQNTTSTLLLSFQPPQHRTPQLSFSCSSSNNVPLSYSSMESETVDGTPSESSNVIFNYHEPLSVNSETKFEQEEILIRNLANRIQPLGTDNDSNESSDFFTDHMATCNNSLTKLVDMMNQKKPEEITDCFHETDKSFEAMPSDRSLVSAFVDRFTDCETNKNSVNRKLNHQQRACQSEKNQILNQTFLAYPSEPPSGFRDDSSSFNLITNQNVISIDRNENSYISGGSSGSSRGFLNNCMLVETSSYSSNDEEIATNAKFYEHGSRIAELKKKLGIESEFFLTNQNDQPIGINRSNN